LHLLHNLSEALEKVLARHHADLKRAFRREEEDQLTPASKPQSLTRTRAVSQAEQARIARQERRRALFTQVQELYAQGWSGASIARMLGIHKKTAVKDATAEKFPESRSDHGRKLAPYLPFLQTQWAAGEHNIAFLYQTIRTQGYAGSETSVRKSRELAPRANQTCEETTKILSSRFEGEKATPTRRSFEPSCHLVGLAKT
jgi:Putative ATPase subunit of terminase (gpP-like)